MRIRHDHQNAAGDGRGQVACRADPKVVLDTVPGKGAMPPMHECAAKLASESEMAIETVDSQAPVATVDPDNEIGCEERMLPPGRQAVCVLEAGSIAGSLGNTTAPQVSTILLFSAGSPAAPPDPPLRQAKWIR